MTAPRYRAGQRVLLHLAYQGTAYAGWQVQPGQVTVQAAVEAVLSRLCDRPVRVHGAGRTDAGVHAEEMPAHFDLPRPFAAEALVRGLNALLPEDIVVRRLAAVDHDFHARFAAVGKLYRYRILNRAAPPLFRRRFVHWERLALDRAAMADGLAPMVGEHDFSSLCAADADATTRVRRVAAAQWREVGDELQLWIAGDGFLKHMVRTLAGTLVEIGRGRLHSSRMAAILAARDRRQAGTTAPARGLCLMGVAYRQTEVEQWRADLGHQ
jgi:tRNA pseudouridine38-40 synthase